MSDKVVRLIDKHEHIKQTPQEAWESIKEKLEPDDAGLIVIRFEKNGMWSYSISGDLTNALMVWCLENLKNNFV